MTGYRNRFQNTAAGVIVSALAISAVPDANAQQRPLSINDWLQAERSNANMQRAVEQYERARFGTVTPPQPQYRMPQYQQPQYPQQAQAPAAAPQQPVQQQPMPQQPTMQQPAQSQPQPLYPNQQPYANQAQPGSQLPQGQAGQNTYQVPPDALEKIDREYNPANPDGSFPSKFYLTGHLGWPFMMDANVDASTDDNSLDMSMLAFRAGGGVGYKFGNGFSAELEGSYQFAEQDGSSDAVISVWALMPMARLEFNSGYSNLSPYITGGLGLAKFQADDLEQFFTGEKASDSGLAMAYQFGAGATYPLSGKTSLDFGYRYFGTTDADLELLSTEYSANMTSHTLLLGVNHQL